MGLKNLFKKKTSDKLTVNPSNMPVALVSSQEIETIKKSFKRMNYPIKVLVAWGEAITGNKEIRDWLIKNGYEELGMFCFAIRNEVSAQQWLIKNRCPHLVALINGIEGDKKALDWLLRFDYEILFHMAHASQGNVDSKHWLLQKDKVYAALAMKMERLKDDIEFSNNDIHTINP
jgi:hypothetical protein